MAVAVESSLFKVSGVLRPQREKRGSLKPLVRSGGGVEGRPRRSDDELDNDEDAEEDAEMLCSAARSVEGKRICGRGCEVPEALGKFLYRTEVDGVGVEAGCVFERGGVMVADHV